MFNQLLESKAKLSRRVGGSIASVVAHALLIGLAVVLTANASARGTEPADERVTFVPPPPPAPTVNRPIEPAPTRPASDVFVAPPPLGTPVLVPPIDVPNVLPSIDLSRAVTRVEDFAVRGVRGGRPDGVVGGTSPAVDVDGIFTLDHVEKPVVMAPGSPAPAYPEALRSAGVDGAVLAQFVVDTLGYADPASLRVLDSAHPLFADAVRRVLPRLRFLPAEAGGRKVRQLVQQPFVFGLNRDPAP